VSRPYPREFRDDVVRVARNRDDGVTIEQIATDFGVHSMRLHKRMGHANATTTGQIYTHVYPKANHADEMAALDALATGELIHKVEEPAGTSCWIGVPGEVADRAAYDFGLLLEEFDPLVCLAQLRGDIVSGGWWAGRVRYRLGGRRS
jgi:hypothetical protein